MFSANASQVSNDVKYIEDFCSVYLRTGTGSSQTVTTGVKENTGALVISKSRSAATDWAWYDTFRGATKELASNTTAAEITQSQGLTSFNTDGHTWGTLAKVNTSGATYVDFVLKPTPKFFDVVTYTGDGVDGRPLAHNLGSVPGCIIIKSTSDPFDWMVWHQSAGQTSNLVLNSTAAVNTNFIVFGLANIPPTSTNIYLGSSNSVNGNGKTYVAYFFAHNAGGFGLTGTDNVISCGSFTTDGSGNATVNLGWEPQLVLYKRSSGLGDWLLLDSMRDMSYATSAILYPNVSDAESSGVSPSWINATATGFGAVNGRLASGATYIYIAIRRGPMKTPTTGTSVFAPVTYTGNGSSQTITAGFPIDLSMFRIRGSVGQTLVDDRLRGAPQRLFTDSTAAETTSASAVTSLASNTGVTVGANGDTNSNAAAYVNWSFRRAPGFFDEVCYTGTGAARTVAHNLAAAPEMMIVKKRSSATASDWYVYHSGMVDLTYPNPATQYIRLNLTNNWVRGASGAWNNTQPTSSVFSLGDTSATNASGQTFVAYLFATLAGVSKVGSYTGTGTTQQINCGFTGGARFIMVKSTSTTGDWIVVDTARGLVSGNDPTLALNSTAAEVTTNDWFDPYSAGFELSSVSGNLANTNGTSYIYLAIA